MSEIQTIKTAIHEIAHAKLHAISPDEKPSPEERKDRRTKEVEAESVAYTVCQRYGIETSDYSFGYIAGWSSDKETKELKGSLETIRSTAAEMIESIDAKLKALLAEKAQEQMQEAPEIVEDEKPSYLDVPVYRDVANYAFEAGELNIYRASDEANMACKKAIEQAISDNYADNRLATRAAVEEVLMQFSEDRVRYVLANTVQHNLHDGRYHAENKDWAGRIAVCEENSGSFIVSQVHPGLVNLFINQFKELTAEKEQGQIEAVPASEFQKDTATKHRLTPDEKQIKDAVMDALKARIAYANDGMMSTVKASEQSLKVMAQNKVRIEGNTVTRNGEPLFAIHRRYSAKKTQGCYRELTPSLEYIKKEKAQETKQEKPSIRDQLRAAKAKSEKQSHAQDRKPKSKEMEI